MAKNLREVTSTKLKSFLKFYFQARKGLTLKTLKFNIPQAMCLVVNASQIIYMSMLILKLQLYMRVYKTRNSGT